MSRTPPAGTAPLNVAVVGGGPGCKAVMDTVFGKHLSRLHMNLVGIADTDPKAPAIMRAQGRRHLYNRGFSRPVLPAGFES